MLSSLVGSSQSGSKDLKSKVLRTSSGLTAAAHELCVEPAKGLRQVNAHVQRSAPSVIRTKNQVRNLADNIEMLEEEARGVSHTLGYMSGDGLQIVRSVNAKLNRALRLIHEHGQQHA